jgi:hypothetical protein
MYIGTERLNVTSGVVEFNRKEIHQEIGPLLPPLSISARIREVIHFF